MAIEKRREYTDYDAYRKHQLSKTLSPYVRKRLKSKFDIHVNTFKSRLSHLKSDGFIKEKQNVLCLGARMGEEVVAFTDLGLNAIGIDLAPCPPLVIEGDFNNLKFDDGSYDVVYTNSFDHAWDAKQFFGGVYRVLKSGGHFIIDVFPTSSNFSDFEVMYVDNEKDVVDVVTRDYDFDLVKIEKKLPHFYKRRHPESQLLFKKK